MGVPSHVEHIPPVGEREGAAGVLLDHDDPDPALADALELVEDHVGGAGGEARGGLVEEEQRGPSDEGAGERHELALAARERAGTLAAALAQERELLDDGGHRVVAVAARERLRPDVEVLGDGEGGKHVVELGDEAEPAPRESVGARARHVVASEGDGAARRADDPGDRLEERRLPRAVRPDHGDDLVGAAVQRDAPKHGDVVVARVEVADDEGGVAHACVPR